MVASSLGRGKPLILHVEDNVAQLQTMRSILEASGFSVLQATTTEEALRFCHETPVSLVLADHLLSDSGGTEFAGQIKRLKPNLPVILHSAATPSSLRHLDGFIHKGEPVSTLLAFIRNMIHRFWE